MAVMRVTVDWVKNRVGRLRPDFWARCGVYDEVANSCSGDAWLVKDGRRSFPSGHSSTAFAGLFFLCLFLAGKNGGFALGATFPRSSLLQSRMLRFSLAVSPLFLAAWIAITRIEDNYHRKPAHPSSTPYLTSRSPAFVRPQTWKTSSSARRSGSCRPSRRTSSTSRRRSTRGWSR